MRIVLGDLLIVPSGFIVQQCNCNTVKSHGLAASIEQRFPFCTVYKQRKPAGRRNCAVKPDEPGTYQLFSAPEQPTIVCLMAQWAPGKPGAYEQVYPRAPKRDTSAQRLTWFVEAMTAFLTEVDWKGQTVSLPHQIGCGLAGGSWPAYKAALEKLEERFDITFDVYKL